MLLAAGAASLAAEPLNVLFIAVDDLRPQLGCYEYPGIITPNIDRLASRGTVFNRAYCQAAVCRASRASLLLGVRPDTTEIWSNGSRHRHFRNHLPDIATLPQHFKNHGYHSQSLGKIFHGAFVVRNRWNDPASWSEPAWWPGPRYYYTEDGVNVARHVFGRKANSLGVSVDQWVDHFVLGLSHEAPEVEDNVLYDGQIADRGIETLRKVQGKPFFLALGFIRPHLPFIAPKKYWDMYPPQKVNVADNRHPPQDVPPMALTNWGHPRTYTDFPDQGEPSDDLVLQLTRGYSACVTYIDAQIGRVLDELERFDLRGNTIVVFWGDHGWHIGENHIWGKATNFELSTRAPLIVSCPKAKAKGRKTNALVEFVDIYPTLCELADLPLPDHLEGVSFAQLLDQPDRPWKTAAFSQYPRGGFMGRSMRTDRYRFTRWTPTNKPHEIAGLELYDHQSDPAENVNVAGRPEHAELVKRLSQQLEAGWRMALPASD
jgi:arylsulfatase A-like enzyme